MKELEQVFLSVIDTGGAGVSDDLARESCESWDSFNHLLLFSEIEKQTGVKFTIAEIEAIKTYKQLREAFEKKNGK